MTCKNALKYVIFDFSAFRVTYKSCLEYKYLSCIKFRIPINIVHC